MKLSKKGAVTLATALVVFLVTTGLMLSRVKDLESSYDEQSKQMQLLKDEYNSLSNELSAEKSERTKYQRLYDEVSIRNEQLEAELENWRCLGQFVITYYWPGEDVYGRLTSTGAIAEEGRTIAVDPSIIPYGSIVLINGNEYVAQDCGGAIKGKNIDIFVDNPKMQKYTVEIYIKREE